MSALLTAACSADDSEVAAPTETSVIGTYSLRVVNGGNLPFPYSATATTRFDIIGGSITLSADHTFADALITRAVVIEGNVGGDPQTETLSGTWSLSGATVSMVYAGHPTPASAVITGTLLTRVDAGLSLTYGK